ncbi:TPA: transporter [Citrobacter freundii]
MNQNSRLFILSAAMLSLASLGSLFPATALADNARDWQNLPKDINLAFGYYDSMNVDAPGADVDADVFLFRYAHTFDIDGRITAIQIIQPYTRLSASLDNAPHLGNFENESLGDTQIVFAHGLFGNPALSTSDFMRWTPEPFLTAAMWLTVPDGQYDKHQVLNSGANRWVFKPELAFGYPIGPVWLELNSWVSFYTDNDDYLGNNTLSQRPQYAGEGHISYTLSPALWVSLDGTWSGGGETKVNGAVQDNEQNNVILGTTLGFQLSPQFGGMIAWSDTVQHKTDSPDIDGWTFRLQYAW